MAILKIVNTKGKYYDENSREQVLGYILNHYKTPNGYIGSIGISREKEAAKFMESHNDITTYYILNDKNFSLNSRRVNIERMKRVCPNKILTFGKFYNSFKYSEKGFLKEVNDRERFNIIKDDDLNEVLNWLSVTLQEIMKLLS